MHRFYIDPESIEGNCVKIGGTDAGHIARVLRLKPGDEIAVCGKSMQNEYFKKLREDNAFNITPKWLERDTENLKGKVVAMPARDDIDYDVAEHLIVELYSK